MAPESVPDGVSAAPRSAPVIPAPMTTEMPSAVAIVI